MDKYTKFILTMIAIGIFGILIKFEVNNFAEAGSGYRYPQILYQVERNCSVVGSGLKCLPMKP